ncbi:Chromo (CHRromatin Organization MOdifier) domain, partial [Aduncisulcus paluster]
LGMLNFIREFIPDCSSLTEPLSRLTKKDIEFVWGDEQEATFKRIKRLLKESPTLSFPEEETKLSLFTDASDVGIGAVLVQGEDENRSVVSFISKTLTSVQRRWSVTEKECWAIVFAITQFERFLKGRHFDLFTDHRSLTFVQRSPNAKITRWWLRIQEFSFSVHHVKGEENGAADCCSRLV